MQSLVHYSLHFLVVGFIAFAYDKKHWLRSWLILIATMVVDLDHLADTPIFDPHRCSIGFHFLHSYVACGIYILGSLFIRNKIVRLIFIGLVFHMLTDALDCYWNTL